MLTGCRPGEAMAAAWEQFDAEPGFWIKPSAQTKQRKIHKAPLGPAALEPGRSCGYATPDRQQFRFHRADPRRAFEAHP